MSQKANNLIERLKSELNIKKDKDLCELLDIKHNTLSTWKKRDTLDFNKIINLCEKHNLGLNYIFFEEEEENVKEEKQQAVKVISDNKRNKLNHFLSTQLVNTNRNISIFYNQVIDENNNSSDEIIVCQKVSVKKITEDNLYVFEHKENTFCLDKLFFINDKNKKATMVHLNQSNKNIDLKSIINVWHVIYTSTSVLKFINGLTPL
jgi:uncharacterized protein YjcR